MMNVNYITYLESQRRSPLTIVNYTKYINMALEYIRKPENEITYMDLVAWKNTFANLKPNSQNIRIAAVKNYFGFLKKAGVTTSNPAEELEKQKVRDCDVKQKPYIEAHYLQKVRDCDVKQKPYIEAHYLRDMVNNARTIRDKAIILLFATTGLRVSELTGITIEQYENMSGSDGRELAIVGKGNKTRRVYINDETKMAIDCYLATRPRSEYNNLFLSFQGGPIHSNNLSQTLKNVAKNAGYPQWQDICNHALRAAFATTKAEQGVPLTTIQSAMGHAKLDTTLIYIKRNQNVINDAMANMAF